MTDQAINVSSGQVYNKTTLTDGDAYVVYSGGEVISTTLEATPADPSAGSSAPNGASVQVMGGLAIDTIVNSATFQTVAGGLTQKSQTVGMADGTIVSSGGAEYVNTAGITNGSIISGETASQIVSGGTASGSIVTADGGQSYSTTAATYAFQEVLGGGLIVGTIASFNAEVGVLDGAAQSVSIIDGAFLILDGGNVKDTLVSGIDTGAANYDPSVVDVQSGIAFTTTVGSAAQLDVYNLSAAASNTLLESFASLSVNSGGAVYGTIVQSDGFLFAYSGGSAFDTQLQSGGKLAVQSGASAVGTIVQGGGELDAGSLGTETGAVIYAGGLERIFGQNALVNDGTLEIGGAIDLQYIPYSFSRQETASLNFATNVLSVDEGSQSFSEQLVGHYAGDVIHIKPDMTSGGTIISLSNPSFPSADFNGDGTSDILFQNTDGTVATWELSNALVTASTAIANPGTSWHEAGTGDFNGDGNSDILYQNDDGTVAIWELNGPNVILGATVANPGTSWHVIGTGDFNEDGKSDILFQNNDGTIDIWNMNGATVASSAVVANPGPQWHAIGTGDFFGTGQSDILLQNDDGTIDIWQMNGDTLVNGTVVANPGPTWHAVGTGDFDGDGKSDILFQNNDGSIAIWEMNGTTVTSGVVVANPGPSWHAVSTGDYNGDGKSDILLQNDDGTVEVWQMNGTIVTAGTVVANPGTQWQTTGQGSMHFIDGTQSTGAVSGTILADNFVFTTSQQGAHIINGFDPVHDVITLKQAQFGSYAAVQAAETTVNGSTVIALGANDTLTINGVLPSALAAKNFV